jgi:hypothetical protein
LSSHLPIHRENTWSGFGLEFGLGLGLVSGLGLRLDLHEEEAPKGAVVALAHGVAQQVAVVVKLGDDAARLLGELRGHEASTGSADLQVDGSQVRRAV